MKAIVEHYSNRNTVEKKDRDVDITYNEVLTYWTKIFGIKISHSTKTYDCKEKEPGNGIGFKSKKQ